MDSTISWPGARAATTATACGRAASVSSVLVRIPGTSANTARAAAAPAAASAVPTRAPSAWLTPTAMTSSASSGADQ